MKKFFAKLLPLSIITLLVSGFFVFSSIQNNSVQPAYAAAPVTWYVDPYGTDDISHGTGAGTLAFKTVQYAVDTAADGDTINVAAGQYAENVEIDGRADITIAGAGTGTSIEPASGIGFAITDSGGITIKNLQIHTIGTDAHGIWVSGTNTDNLTVQNTTIIVDGYSSGIYGGEVSPARTGWLIGGGVGLGNTITVNPGTGVTGDGMDLYDVSASEVSYNTITLNTPTDSTNVLWFSELSDLSDLVFSHNTVSGSSGSEVAIVTDFMDAPPDTTITTVTIEGNTFSNWGSRAIRVGAGDGVTPGTVTGIEINSNTFQMTEDVGTEVIGGTDAASATGEGNTFNVSSPAKIQKAIDSAFDGDTINVADGTYTENVTIDKSLTLTGAGSSTVTVTAADPAVSVFTVTANDVEISGLTASGASGGGQAGIYISAGVTGSNIHDNILTGSFDGIWLGSGSSDNTLANNTLSSNYQGFEVYISSNNTFENNTANSNTNYGFKIDSGDTNAFTGNTANSNTKYGFYVVTGDGGGATNSTFTNNTANLNTQYGIRINGGTGNTLTGNTFDANVLAGFRLKEVITGLGIQNNNITNSPIGIDIDVSVTDVTELTVTDNNISGNATGVSNLGIGILDATENWWGTAVKTDIGLKITGLVNFVPYYIEAGKENLSNITDITSFDFTSPAVTGTVVDSPDYTVALTVPYGTDVTDLTPTIVLTQVTPAATINPTSGEAQDFSRPVIYTVTAIDETTQPYTVTVTVVPTIITFNIPEQVGITTINEATNEITVTMPYDTDVTDLVPTITIEGESVDPASGAAQNFTDPVTYTVTAADDSAQDYEVTVNVLADDQTAPDEDGNATVDNDTPQVVITDPDQAVTVTIESGTTDPTTIDVRSLVTDGEGTMPKININSGNCNVAIPDGTIVTGAAWDGVITAPTVTTVTLPAAAGETRTLSMAVEIGFAGTKLSFDKAVRLLLPGQAGKRAGYMRGTNFTEITATCGADNEPAETLALAYPDGDCKKDVDSNLVIWTKHFTAFTTFTSTPVTVACNNGLDDDGDTLIDMADPNCSSPLDTGEAYEGGGGGGGGGGGQTNTTSNTTTSTISSNISGTITGNQTYSRPIQLSADMITDTADGGTSAVLTDGGDTVVTMKPNSQSTISMTIPSDTTVTSTAGWNGRIEPPLIKSVTMINLAGEEIVGSDDELQRSDVTIVVKAGANTPLTFDNPVTINIPVDLPDGTVVQVYTSNDGDTWTSEGTAVVKNGIAVYTTTHLTYFALGKAEEKSLKSAAPAEVAKVIVNFMDIAGHWAESYIEQIAALGIVNGKTSTAFAPNDNITRAELVKIAVNAFGYEVPASVTERPAGDVAVDSWYAPYIQAARDAGIIYNLENSFGPNVFATRAFAVTVLVKAGGYTDVETNYQNNYASHAGWTYVGFPDVPMDEWYSPYIAYLKDSNVVHGYLNGLFGPADNITRAEIAKIVVRMLDME